MADEQKNVEVPEKFKGLVEQIEKLTVSDLAELVKVLEGKFGVSAAQTFVGAPVAGAPSAATAPVEEQTTFNVELTESGSNKIGVIKVLREITQLGLKDAKDMVDGAPKMVKEGVGKAEAETMKKKLEEAGAKATLK
ncbi:50S ribosomal protein L7/L12 [Candidatus Uhrbacteria bacterium RIFCSPLOWO2_01_FULL_47_24]|uniref:Large ribosomal subunit protein bL12 n=1 Tax=Candidatus Uhrbacteria bacterium RIFCSPLOWO2_01_FULL_47_24 TaxID=1802401 RepID=A0A1F7UQT0_9BACT|nr:MAG: 50S ribosomal protein L7/L12 [Candidatus Uhrbacteria bacterium RIFCSPHIGHO2_01_FULL_47_11]OGL67898.1 MAG: 50S ribosomal protein L7/L12 [Candidatus Uhrbacteria bacterium RIFCSPHIGHO2_02_FULL_46_47]OGL75329.1 MAG: 50S ribosomal protein L7/L12 [Candidatus Uhrbacteria bacterium RIFCSPHIGHO2_12_FULL_47_11]OGL80084.1 MAG: 50S ribosomal protein L7/L12 [Candidatus Uhrbacteria bacterium RIFCSPLOWO2_01_FULL_47_24]OGL84870.1 MAG: 50S ribosomal protein L7/L12 [Candidatus Uhrbacteria bacterium RIFCS